MATEMDLGAEHLCCNSALVCCVSDMISEKETLEWEFIFSKLHAQCTLQPLALTPSGRARLACDTPFAVPQNTPSFATPSNPHVAPLPEKCHAPRKWRQILLSQFFNVFVVFEIS